MAQVPCAICTAPTRAPNLLCDASVEVLRDTLREVPILAHQLNITIAKLSRIGSGGGGRSIGFAEVGLPLNLGAADVLRTLRLAVENACYRHGGEEAEYSLLGNARWLTENLKKIRVSPYAVHTWRDITEARERALRAIDRPPDTWYAGKCDQDGADLYVQVGAVAVRCRQCRTQYGVQERREILMDKARAYRGTASYLAQALTPLLGRRIDPGRLHTLASRGRLPPVGADAKGRPLYRVGDVLDLLNRPEAVRHEKPTTRRSQ